MIGQESCCSLLMAPLQWSTGWLLCSMPEVINAAMWWVSS